jgi:hypothetical protein
LISTFSGSLLEIFETFGLTDPLSVFTLLGADFSTFLASFVFVAITFCSSFLASSFASLLFLFGSIYQIIEII